MMILLYVLWLWMRLEVDVGDSRTIILEVVLLMVCDEMSREMSPGIRLMVM